jgi:two-component system nitrate/nitrite response regulator NarL
MTPATVRILVVDDHPVVLDGVTLALQATPWLRIVGYARNGADAINQARALRPEVVLLDVRLPDMLGPEVVPALQAAAPGVRIVLFTAHPDHVAAGAALAAGADGLVVKDTERADLVHVISRVVAGERVICAGLHDDGQVLLAQKLRQHGLTRREYEILRHVAMGKTNPEIAEALGLARNTVKTYLQRALEKLHAHNRVEALARASQLGIL